MANEPALQLEIRGGGAGYIPAVVERATLTTERKNVPGKLTFAALWDDKLAVEEGNLVRLSVNGQPVFAGFVFTLSRTKAGRVQITAYDQLRYLLNKDTYVFENATAAAMIRMIAADYGVNVGEIEETGYVIPSRVLDNRTLLDMMQDSLEMTLTNTGTLYCLYDDAGALTLRQASRMKVGLMLDGAGAEDFSYASSIDGGVYNAVKLVCEEDADGAGAGQRRVFQASDPANQGKWGTLQYFEVVADPANAGSKARALLALYNAKRKTLSVRGALGDVRVRAGSLIMVRLDLGDTQVASWMMVESCTHVFAEQRHSMDLKLRGGGFT